MNNNDLCSRVIKVILSCRNKIHLDVAHKYFNLAAKYLNSNEINSINMEFQCKRLELNKI